MTGLVVPTIAATAARRRRNNPNCRVMSAIGLLGDDVDWADTRPVGAMIYADLSV